MVRERAPKKATRADGYTAGWYDYRAGDICLAYWDGDSKVIERQPFRNHFYLTEDDYKQVRSRDLDSYLDDVKSSGKYVKLYSTGTRNDLRNLVDWIKARGAEPLEADLPPIARFLTDHPVKFNDDPRVLFFDLETDARTGWSHKEEHRILSVSWWSESTNPGNTIVAESDDDKGESDLLEKFGQVIGAHDLLVAWNGNEYDEPVIRARCKHNGMYPAWQTVGFLDLMEVFKHPYFGYGRDTEGTGVKLTFGLDVVGDKLLGMPKMNLVKEMQQKHGLLTSHPAQAIYMAWMQDQLLLKQYNSRDVQIMVRLEQKFGYVDGLKTISHICNRFLSSYCIHTGYLNDSYILRHGVKTGVHFPTKFHFYGSDNPFIKKEKMEGAFVAEPKPGLYNGVCCLDFASLYPNVIRSFNISPETFVCMDDEFDQQTGDMPSEMCTAGNGAMFRFDVEGTFPAMVADTMGNRAQFKILAQKLEEALKEGSVEHRKSKQRSDSYKVISNSGFGIMGSQDHRYYSRECGEAVTLTGKQIILLIIEEAEKRGYLVVYGDTDSLYICCPAAQAIQFIDDMAVVIDQWVEERGGEPGFIRLELDFEYTRMLPIAKKCYAGKKTTGKIDVKGLAYIRTDGSKIRQKFQKEVIDYLLEADVPSIDIAREIVERWRDNLFNMQIDIDDLIITKGVQTPPDQIDVPHVHHRVAMQMVKDGREFYLGMKVPYILTGESVGPSKSKGKRLDAVHPDDFKGQYDAALYWRKQVFPATQLVLEAAFPKLPWKAMLKYKQGDQKQTDMMTEIKKVSVNKVTLVIGHDDLDNLLELKKAMEKYPGDHQLVLDLDDGEGNVVSAIAGFKVALVPDMIKAAEKIVGRRCYFGPEEWDDATGTS